MAARRWGGALGHRVRQQDLHRLEFTPGAGGGQKPPPHLNNFPGNRNPQCPFLFSILSSVFSILLPRSSEIGFVSSFFDSSPRIAQSAPLTTDSHIARRPKIWVPFAFGPRRRELGRYAVQLGFDAAPNVLKEFWPDLKRKLPRRLVQSQQP